MALTLDKEEQLEPSCQGKEQSRHMEQLVPNYPSADTVFNLFELKLSIKFSERLTVYHEPGIVKNAKNITVGIF
jgi:hypothetical protein